MCDSLDHWYPNGFHILGFLDFLGLLDFYWTFLRRLKKSSKSLFAHCNVNLTWSLKVNLTVLVTYREKHIWSPMRLLAW